jgi:diaminopimelate epimerase
MELVVRLNSYLLETGLKKEEINLETRAGIKNIKINKDDTYSVDMGAPSFVSPDFPTSPTGGKKIEGYVFNCVSMGNPHAVTLCRES